MNFVLDSKHRKPVSELEAMSPSPSGECLVLVRPSAQLTSKGTCTQKSFVTDNHKMMHCKDSTTDISSSQSSDELVNFYRGTGNITRTSASTGSACSRLLNAMNSYQW